MDHENLELIENIRQQFDNTPFPRIPLEESPKDNSELLYLHNLVTAYYFRNRKVINTSGKVILDAGCGTGYKSLVLAIANPGAKIVGIDLSEESVKLAEQRLQYHGVANAEFYALKIEELPSLGLQFDYINADEVLYLLPDAIAGLQAMKSVMAPDGIIRTNLHSSNGRAGVFRGQAVFKAMGLMDGSPGELEIEIVRETMEALEDGVGLKAFTWNSDRAQNESWIMSNYLLVGDKGSTIPEVFAMLRSADLEFINMVAWRRWELMDLFKDADDLPPFLAMSLPEASLEERLHLFDLLHPLHRLFDFWCGNPNRAQDFVPVAEWTEAQWPEARVHLHPQLRTSQIREDLTNCIESETAFEISRYIIVPTLAPVAIESKMAACLLPLWEGPQSVVSLVQKCLQIRSQMAVNPEPVSEQTAFEEVKELLLRLELFLYVLLEH
ncbi:class I SAM-dependent methyltransferase [Microcoleus sp. LEGE 07076]|uniref:class I SAM-dependent methyltransferase n=1 Tax=Microcoleus sp. LEGE 07076 TaxID=915322 RepID=UPI001881D961|nr:class I SAM-dependent methyltransferase [Microcoleus sp. LEGE 07076]MBE9183561.1 class I SAM-dependent methyltransferase [Microcoleus sp. LEGE 07076]